MSNFEISIESTNGVFQAGEAIRGSLSVSSLPPKTESIEIRLLWFTRGKGDRDLQVVATQTETRFQVGQSIPFEFMAPKYPHSFSLKLVSLIWTIEAIAFPGRIAANKEIVISPTGKTLQMKQFEVE